MLCPPVITPSIVSKTHKIYKIHTHESELWDTFCKLKRLIHFLCWLLSCSVKYLVISRVYIHKVGAIIGAIMRQPWTKWIHESYISSDNDNTIIIQLRSTKLLCLMGFLMNIFRPNLQCYILLHCYPYTDGLARDCSNSSALETYLLQFCTKPSIY